MVFQNVPCSSRPLSPKPGDQFVRRARGAPRGGAPPAQLDIVTKILISKGGDVASG